MMSHRSAYKSAVKLFLDGKISGDHDPGEAVGLDRTSMPKLYRLEPSRGLLRNGLRLPFVQTRS